MFDETSAWILRVEPLTKPNRHSVAKHWIRLGVKHAASEFRLERVCDVLMPPVRVISLAASSCILNCSAVMSVMQYSVSFQESRQLENWTTQQQRTTCHSSFGPPGHILRQWQLYSSNMSLHDNYCQPLSTVCRWRRSFADLTTVTFDWHQLLNVLDSFEQRICYVESRIEPRNWWWFNRIIVKTGTSVVAARALLYISEQRAQLPQR